MTTTLGRIPISPVTLSIRSSAIEPVGTLTPASEWVIPLPKVELHLHLEGAMRSATVAELSIERQGWHGALPPGWENSYYTYTDFAGFMSQLTPRFPGRPDEYGRIARECFEDLAAQSVIYAEVSFDAPVREVGNDSRFWPIVDVLEEERQRAEERFGIRLNYILALMRTLPPEVALYRVELAHQARERGIGIVGIDLHGDETMAPAGLFVDAFRLAERYGFGLRAHAGEAMGAESIRASLDLLNVKRIAHGIHAMDDPDLLRRLATGDVTLEVCPTSNVRTALVPDLAHHPIRQFYEMGIPVTVNSDDPLPFFTSIEREYRLLVDQFGMGPEALHHITLTAINAAFIGDAEKRALAAQIDRAYGAAEKHLQENAS